MFRIIVGLKSLARSRVGKLKYLYKGKSIIIQEWLKTVNHQDGCNSSTLIGALSDLSARRAEGT